MFCICIIYKNKMLQLQWPYFNIITVRLFEKDKPLPPPYRKQTQMISRVPWHTRNSPSSIRWCLWDGTCSCWWWRTVTGRITWQWRSWPISCVMNRRWGPMKCSGGSIKLNYDTVPNIYLPHSQQATQRNLLHKANLSFLKLLRAIGAPFCPFSSLFFVFTFLT